MAFRRDKALQAAQRFVAKGEFDKAIREFQSLVENEPGDIPSWLMLADSLHRAGELDQAIERWVHAAELHLHAGDVPQALGVFRQILDLAPERYDVHLRTAQAFEQVRRTPEAVALYERVASVYLRSGNTREALQLYERVADLAPRDVSKRLRLAELYSRERRVDEAVQHFELGAGVLWQAGKPQEYIRVAERLLYHRPLDHVLHQLVRAYLELGQPRRALMKLNELLQRQSGDPEGLELLAETFVQLGKVDKAVSVVIELARTQRDGSPDAKQRAFVVACKAASWAPQNSEVIRILAEFEAIGLTAPKPAALVPEPDDEEIEEFDEVDAEEIEEFDEVEEAEEVEAPTSRLPARTTTLRSVPTESEDRVQPRRHSLTDDVISEGTQQRTSDEHELVDFDKQFEEVRVLMKYHLFEHAMGHIEAILRRSPRNLIALELQAEVLGGLDRVYPAADVRAHLAELLADRDPQAAARQVELALALVPDHPVAKPLAAQLAEISGVDIIALDPSAARPSSTDPLSDLDLADDVLGAIEASESLIGRVDPGLSDPDVTDLGDPLGDLDGSLSSMNSEELMTEGLESRVMRESLDGIDTPQLDDADGIDIRMADPSLHGELNRLADDSGDFAISVDHEQEVTHDDGPISFEDRFGLDEDDEGETEAEPAGMDEIEAGDSTIGRFEAEPEPEPAAGLDFEEADEPVEEVAPEPEPQPAAAAVHFAELTAELDELEFFVAQDLEEDALFAFEDLVRKHPGHPELAKIAHRFPNAAGVEALMAAQEQPAPEPAYEPEPEPAYEPEPGFEDDDVDAAEPLLNLDEADEDDDFLAGIFDSDAPSKRKAREVTIQTHEVEGADAGDHFDLGTAYREMGLIDDALREYSTAAKDPRWQAKALVMMGALHAGRGESDAAVEHLQRAATAARTKDERCEANYELAMNLIALGRDDEARTALEQVDAGFRDRDDKLRELTDQL